MAVNENFSKIKHIWNLVQDELSSALSDAKHGFHYLCFANTNKAFEPEARVVVLRDFDAKTRSIVFHTDIRSQKCEQIKLNSAGIALFYDSNLKIQLRFKVIAKTHYNDKISLERWHKTPKNFRRIYLKILAPGSIIQSDAPILPDQFRSKSPDLDQSEEGFKNFAVIHLSFHNLEILKLNSYGNECFRIEWQGEEMIFNYIAP